MNFPKSRGTPKAYDARGLICPLPVLRARKILAAMQTGEELQILTDDPVARIDLPHFCAEAGHRHLGVEDGPEGQLHRILRGAEAGD
ncbi:sulfurtransferase TusA family protein [Limimaricola pyoseonensis]|uniref:tRNA 2-thiouridine synthesizing protein A n=1 Tax=Limimaricola pyoseonensis TaxID=521013 RepID=A0A1G7A4I9_9RHOB|nr:sulfurtransferase TusA family protein [Limimaricola pyoseonensis]SDE09690.1 tRNA 2-thiouridine synthesizing protein A [Limimaricola pyoseonensis]